MTATPTLRATTRRRPVESRRQIVNRLRRAYGQLGASIAAVESGAGCRDVVTQLAAVSSAVDRAGFAIVSDAMRRCLDPDDDGTDVDGLSLAEVEKLFTILR